MLSLFIIILFIFDSFQLRESLIIRPTHISSFRKSLPNLFVNLYIVTLSSDIKLRPVNHNYLFTQWTEFTVNDAYFCLSETYFERWKNVWES